MTDSKTLINAIFAAYNRLGVFRREIDKINVFPVADGDTGTNMLRTVKAGAEAVKSRENKTPAQILLLFSKAMLRNARGNSGVILSVLFKGFSDSVEKRPLLAPCDLAAAFEKALEQAKSVLSEPIYDGTILSVALAAKNAAEASTQKSAKDALDGVSKACLNALEKTKTQMKNLKKSDIPDSGAFGLYLIISSFVGVITDTSQEYNFDFSSFDFAAKPYEDRFTYCTEFIILKNGASFLPALESKLQKIGGSVAVAADDEIVKVHLHTNDPDLALGHALSYGALTDIKIDNMASMKSRNQRI